MKQAGSNDAGWVDLHIHSTASDGTLSPEQILKMAQDLNLRAISITDHDTIKGAVEAHRHLTPDVELLSGIEISTSLQGNTLHILGYLIDLKDPALSRTLSILQNARKERNPKIIQKLQQLGIELTYEEVVKVSGGGEVGRPHIAEVLLQKKVVRSINEAFQKYLGANGPAYVDKYRLQPAEAISLIADAGGVPVLAHPFTIKTDSERDLDKIVSELVSNGLKGIEVHYSEHTDIQTLLYEQIAQKHELLITGGTDFHGARKAGVYLGVGKGNLRIPYRLVEALKEYKQAHS